MPRCSACGGSRHKDWFSNAQLQKPNLIRRCKACVEGEVETVAPQAAGRRVPTSLEQNDRVPEPVRASNSSQLATFQELADKLLSPDRIRGVPEDLREPAVLRDHLLKVLALRESTAWLIEPLIKGLLEGHSSINVRLRLAPSQPDPPTILVHVSQWKLLNRAFGWQGRDEIVSMVLATPGVDVSAVLENKCNAAFFAVKYGSPKTLDLLIEAGINMQQRDHFGRTVLYNALEYPNPEMLRRVLDYVPATEMFLSTIRNGRELHMSASDRILDLYRAIENQNDDGKRFKGSISWINLGGPPSVQDVAESLILVRQRGAFFTLQGSEFAWAAVGYYSFSGGTESVIAPEDLMQLAKSMLGFWLPRAVQDQVIGMDEEVTGQQASGTDNIRQCTASTTGECPICLDPVCKKTALYCGHSFCRQCIIDYGKHSGKVCPMCRQRLCKEISPRTEGDAAATDNSGSGNLGNIDSNMGIMEVSQLRGLSALSDSQVSEETKIQGIYSMFSSFQSLRAKLLDQVSRGHDLARRGSGTPVSTVGDARMTVLELSATHSITNGGDFIVMAPSRGPVIVEIVIKGVPVVAHISNNSRYTTISAAVAKTFNLKRLEKLRSLAFRDALTGKRLKNMSMTCLEKFIFSVGGVEVTLRNAVEIDPDMNGIGVQLGQDFFLSAAWCAVDVQIGAHTTDSRDDQEAFYMRTDGIASWLTAKCDSESSLRYYSHGGKTAHLPLLHFNPHTDARINAITLKADTIFTECSWCCRTFPEGMRSCPVCYDAGEDVYYCDEGCQKAAWKVHKANTEGH
jgi:hypothetical protein